MSEEVIYGSITADMQAVLRKGVLYERSGHVTKHGRWRKVRDTREQLEAVCDAWDKAKDLSPAAYRAKCLLSCLNDRTNMWRIVERTSKGERLSGQ